MKKRKPLHDEAKVLAEQAYLLRYWHKWHQEQLREALAGPDGVAAKAVMDLLLNIETTPASRLIARVRSIDWSTIAYDVRLTLLHQINEAVTALREARGLAPIDDGLEHEPDGVFRLTKQLLFP
jgi:hypothetical protein